MTPLPEWMSTGAEQTRQTIGLLHEIKPAEAADPASIEILYALGFAALRARQHDQAQGLFAALVSQQPTESRFVAGRALASAGVGDLDLALQLHRLAVALDTDNTRLLLGWAETLIALGQRSEAAVVLELIELAARHDDSLAGLRERARALGELINHDA